VKEPAAPRFGLVIPTLNAGEQWNASLAAIGGQQLPPYRRLVIDSSSTDETTSLARSAGFEVIEIPRTQFNHGGTRQWAAEYLTDCEILVFLTQDAILAEPTSFGEIARCFDDPNVAVAYGRQLPHVGATPIEAHARLFNYGTATCKKSLATVAQIGAKVAFCSNSFAAYNRRILMDSGGFRDDLILGEDMEFAARAVMAGYENVYCATAVVFHSHDYTVRQTLERYFDIGVFDGRNAWLRDAFGSHRGEGLRFAKSELRFLIARAPWQIPRALLHTAAKLVGYRLGRIENAIPKSLKRLLSMQPSYWRE
jgi:rhamnosyltransferase